MGDHRKLQLNELNELRDQAYENSLIYKERTKKLHDSKIKNRIFNVGDRVLLFNSRLKIFSRKLKTRWSGPFTITKVFPYGTIELSQPDGLNFKVNGHRVKHYFGGDLPPKAKRSRFSRRTKNDRVKYEWDAKQGLVGNLKSSYASVMRTASAAAKPCQGDSLKFYLITGSIYTDQRGTVVIATVFNEVTKTLSSIKVKEFQRSFRHSDTERLSRSDEVLKLKNFKKDATLKLFKSTNQESEAWERFKEMLRACPHHGFTELTQIDTFYNSLNDNDQDSLNAAAGGNLLSKTTREALNIIENKSKVRYSRNRSNASRMNATSSKSDERINKLADQLSTLVEIVSKKVVTSAPVKAVEETCVTCGGAYSWYNCLATDNNQASVCATTGTYNQINPPNRVSNQMAPPGFAPVQNNGQNRFNQNQVQGNNVWGNNFHVNQGSGMRTEKTTDKEQTNFQGSTAQIPPPVIPISIPESDVLKSLPKTNPIPKSDIPKSLPKPNIPYPP
ncbi:hypothetical protein Tco_0836120 [Tanacetum coccineum]